MNTLLTVPDFYVGSGDPDSVYQARSLYAEPSLFILPLHWVFYHIAKSTLKCRWLRFCVTNICHDSQWVLQTSHAIIWGPLPISSQPSTSKAHTLGSLLWDPWYHSLFHLQISILPSISEAPDLTRLSAFLPWTCCSAFRVLECTFSRTDTVFWQLPASAFANANVPGSCYLLPVRDSSAWLCSSLNEDLMRQCMPKA